MGLRMSSPMREHLVDIAKATPAVGWWATWFWGVNWTVLGAFLMALYTALLIFDKLGILEPVKEASGRFWKNLALRFWPQAPPP